MATARQIEANRRNGRLGGPKTPEGKAISRLNARKHGIFASALTPQDEEELSCIHDEVVDWIKPVGPLEGMLVEKLAQTYLRLQRCARAEAEYHMRTWEPKLGSLSFDRYQRGIERLDEPNWFDARLFRTCVKLFAQYDRTLTNQFIKLMHEIERLQRMRAGDKVAAPLSGDITLHAGGQ